MSFCTAISLLLLLLRVRHGASAFEVSISPSCDRKNVRKPGATRQQYQLQYQQHQRKQVVLHSAASLEDSTVPTLESILDDGFGHINSNLAQAIYEWERAHSGQPNGSMKKEFSTRDGLRLVDEQARDISSSLVNEDDSGSRELGMSYGDLVQEGLGSLLDAMSTYESYRTHAEPSASTFEDYARESIHSSLLHFLARSSCPIRLPMSLQTTLESANAAAEKLRQTLGKEPTLAQVAREVNVTPEQLKLHRGNFREAFVSFEDGMEIYDPTLGLRARRDSDSAGGTVSGGTAPVGGANEPREASSPAADNERDLTELNSQEDDWTREPPERMVAPLRDVFADTEEINNPLSYTHHHLLNEELDEFLRQTLDPEQLTVIQLRFGLVDSKYGGKGWTANEIARRMGMDHGDVVSLASCALEKLRTAARETNWEEDNDAFVEVSL